MTNFRSALLTTATFVAFANEGYTPQPKDIEMIRANAERAAGANDVDDLKRRGKDSAFMLPYWDQVDAIIRGIKGMRQANETFLPKFSDEDDASYNERLSFTKMTNVFRDIVESLSSKPFEQEVQLSKDDAEKVPEELKKFIEDVDGSGNNLTQYSGDTFFNGIAYAVDWIMVDYPKTEGVIRTIADQKAANLRPYWSHVLGRNVLDAKSKVIGGKEVLTYIKILEPGDVERIREYERADTGVIRWRVSVKSSESGKFVLENEGTLTIDEIPMVPFATGRRDGRSWKFDPALSDAADLQVELYQQESGLKFASVLTAYPMLAGNGVKPPLAADGKTPIKLAVGPKRVLYAPPDSSGTSGSWSYVEPAAASLKFLSEQIKETTQELRELGKQPLTAQSGNLTVITTAVAAGKAKSAVAQWALVLKNALENAFVITCKYFNISPDQYDPQVYVYSEFDDFTEGKDLDALKAMRDGGDLSQITYWSEMRRRKVLSPDFDADEEAERLLKEVPTDDRDIDDGAVDDPTEQTGKPPEPVE